MVTAQQGGLEASPPSVAAQGRCSRLSPMRPVAGLLLLLQLPLLLPPLLLPPLLRLPLLVLEPPPLTDYDPAGKEQKHACGGMQRPCGGKLSWKPLNSAAHITRPAAPPRSPHFMAQSIERKACPMTKLNRKLTVTAALIPAARVSRV